MADDGDRLNAIDDLWMELQAQGPPIAIGNVAVAAGPAPSDAQVRAMLADRLDRMPRLSQRLSADPLGVRRPVWVDAGSPDLALHVQRVDARAGPAGGLAEAVSHIMEQPLPPDRPLWDLWVVDGLDRTWALVWRLHHTVADGMGAVSILGHGFDLAPEGAPTLADHLAAGGAPGPSAGPGSAQRRSTPPDGVRSGLGGLADLLGAVRGAAPHVLPTLGSLVPHRPGPLTGEVGDHRTWVAAELPLADVKRVGHALGGTVNDVVLACVAGGFRELLIHRGEPVSGRVVRTLVPVSMRPPGDHQAHNEVSAMLGVLPVGSRDPAQRLRDVQSGLRHGRQVRSPLLVALFLGVVDRVVPSGIQGATVAIAGRSVPAWFLDTVTTNVPGPQFPLYVCGRRVSAMYPLIPIAGHTCITVGAFSYDGMLDIGVTGDADRAGDVGVLARGIQSSATELLACVGP